MEIDPDTLAIADRYKLLTGSIVPRPIALVSTISPEGAVNVAPFSFFAGVGSNPMTVLFCPANGPDGGEKDTLRNCKPPGEGGQGEFVVNAVAERFAAQMAACAEPVAPGVNEMDLVGLTSTPSATVAPPRVAESPISLECRTLQVIRTNPGEPAGGNIVIGRVLRVHLADGLADERLRISPEKLDAVGRMGGLSYCFTRDLFSLPMGLRALDGQVPGE